MKKSIFGIICLLVLMSSMAFANPVVYTTHSPDIVGKVLTKVNIGLAVVCAVILVITLIKMLFDKVSKKEEQYNKSKKLSGHLAFILLSIVFMLFYTIVTMRISNWYYDEYEFGQRIHVFSSKTIIALATLAIIQLVSTIISYIYRFKSNKKKASYLIMSITFVITFIISILFLRFIQ